MTMKLAKANKRIFSVLAASFCLVPLVWAQGTATPKAAPKTKSGATAHKASTAKAAAPTATPNAASTAPAAQKPEPVAAKRDPFNALISQKKDNAAAANLPPGKAGLQVGTVRVDGTVRSGDGMMIAVVSNPEEHVYFVREGDRLYDGDVEKISLDGVTFRENSKDAFGKPVERVVTKRIYASAGALQ
jgi:Tfp pilus assembly protein PilP